MYFAHASCVLYKVYVRVSGSEKYCTLNPTIVPLNSSCYLGRGLGSGNAKLGLVGRVKSEADTGSAHPTHVSYVGEEFPVPPHGGPVFFRIQLGLDTFGVCLGQLNEQFQSFAFVTRLESD